VFSTEPLRFPQAAEACALDGEGNPAITGLNCAGFGSSMVVTASFGLVAAAQVLRKLAAATQVGNEAVGTNCLSIQSLG
jgi:tRNA A37 threonylcarbamoyladenosine dehydratase